MEKRILERLRRGWRCSFFSILTTAAISAAGAEELLPTPSIEDAIQMSRIPCQVAPDGTVGTISRDGKRFVTVTWRGDLARNTNVYSLVLFDLTPANLGRTAPRTVLNWEYAGGPESRDCSAAFEQVTFLADNRTVAFLGRKDNAPRQLYMVDVDSGKLRQLTSSPTEVPAFAAGGESWMFAALVDAPEHFAREQRLATDGVFLWDTDLFVPAQRFKTKPILFPQPRWVRQYHLQNRRGVTSIYDSRQARPSVIVASQDGSDRGVMTELHDEETLSRWSSLGADRQGRYALMYPYVGAEGRLDASRFDHYRSADSKLDTPYGLIDLRTGKLEKLIDAPHPMVGKDNGLPVWSPDGRSVAIYSLTPPAAGAGTSSEPPRWIEVDIATRAVTPLNVPAGWRLCSWARSGELILCERHKGYAVLSKDATGHWGSLKTVDAAKQLNQRWQAASNGPIIIGVKDATYSPPELVAIDVASGTTTTLTDLNPALRARRYAPVEVFRWEHQYDPDASGFLIKPIGFEPGRRYPLVVLLDDGKLSGTVNPYLLDAVFQLNGHAIQMLAAQGLMVLYTREPKSLFTNSAGVTEGARITRHIEAALEKLEQQGLIDPQRVGVSGWSRAGSHVDSMLMQSSRVFAAASKVDGGGGGRARPRLSPYADDELQRIRTPILFEPHGLTSMIYASTMWDRLEAFGRPAEVLYLAAGAHLAARPQHRWRSLQTHVDWWRFWLQDYEDNDPAKAEQYRHWREMRATWEATRRASSPERQSSVQ